MGGGMRRYEEVAAEVLDWGWRRSEKYTLLALEAPLKQHGRWSALDLVVKGGGRAVVDRCPELCVQVRRRHVIGVVVVVVVVVMMMMMMVVVVAAAAAARRHGPWPGPPPPCSRPPRRRTAR